MKNQADAMVRRGVQSGVTEDQIQSQQEDIFANAKQQAVSSLRANFILQEIARAEKELDALTKTNIDAIDDALKRKEAELLEV